MDSRDLAALTQHPRDIGAGYLEYGYPDDRVILKAKYEVCPEYEGKGKYINPSIDAHGLTQNDFDRDPEFQDNYYGGIYDIACKVCGGDRVVPVPDKQHCSSEQVKAYHSASAPHRPEVIPCRT